MSVCLEASSSTVLSQASSQVQQVVSGTSATAVSAPTETLPPLTAPAPSPVIGTQVTTSIKCTSATGGSKVIVANAQALATSVSATSGAGIIHHKQPVITVVNNPLALKGLPNAVAVAAPTYTLNPSVVKNTNSVTLANVPAASLVGLTTTVSTIITANLDKDASLNNNNNNTEKKGSAHNVFVKKSSLVDGSSAVAAPTGGASMNVVVTTPQLLSDQHHQQQIPLSHKILTANTFPSNNVITNLNSTPILKTTVNGQRPLNSNNAASTSNKVKIISNMMMTPATTLSHPPQHLHHINTNSNQLTVPSQQQQIPQQHVQQQPSAGPSHGKPQPQQLRYYQPTTAPHQLQQPLAKLVPQLSVQQSQHNQVVIGNGATKYLNNKGTPQGIIHCNLGGSNTTILNSSVSSIHPISQQHTLTISQQHQATPPNQQVNQQQHPQQQISMAERKMVYHATATSTKNKTCQAAYKGPGAIQRTGAGLRTIPPQKPSGVGAGPVKTNYIGKHAVQAQRIKHTKAKITKTPLHPSYTNTTVGQTSLHHTSQQQLHITRPPPAQLTFNQALTAQILETLGTDAPYKSMNHNHYDQLQQQQQQHHLSNSSSLPSLSSHQPLSCGQGSLIVGMVSPPFASPPHYGGSQVYQQQYQQRRNEQHQEQRHQQQSLQSTMSEEDQFTNLDKLSLVCQTILLDHNYHIKSPQPDNHPQSTPSAAMPNVLSTPNALLPPLMSPTRGHAISGLPQLPLPSALTGLTALGQQHHHLNGLLTSRERRNSRAEMLQHRDQHSHLQLQQHKQQPHPSPHQTQQPSHIPHTRNNSISSTTTHLHEDDAASDISDSTGPPFRPGIGDTEGEETDTAPEAEAETDQQQQGNQVVKDVVGDGHGYGDYVTRCICGFIHDDGYMIECDRCKVWQHVRCVVRNRKVPDDYMCEECEPGKICDRQRARTLQQQWMREIQERDAKERETRMRKENLLHQNNHGQPGQHSDTDSSDNDGVGGVRMVNVGIAGNTGTAGKRRKDGVGNRRQTRGGPGGARAKRKERKIPTKRSAKNNKNQAQNDALSTALAVVSAQLNEADKLPQLRQWIENYEEAVTNHYSPELRARVSSIRVNGAHSDLGKVEPNVHKCKVQNIPPGVKCLLATSALQANTPVVELRGKYMLSTQHKNSNLTLNNHAVVLRNYRPPGPFLFFHKLRDTTEVCVDTRTYGNSARFIRRSCTSNCHLRHVIEKGTLHLYIVTQRALSRGDELTIAHDESHDQLTISQLLEMPCACAQPATCALAQRITVTEEKVPCMTGEGRRRRGRCSRDSIGVVVPPPVEETPVIVKTEIKEEEIAIKQEPEEDLKMVSKDVEDKHEIRPPSPFKKEKKEHTQHFAKSASDFLLENQQRNNNKICESIESNDVHDGPIAARSKSKVENVKTEEKSSDLVEITKVVSKVKEEIVTEASIATRSTTKKETSQCVKLEDDEDDDDDAPPPPVSIRRSSTKHLSEDKESAKDSNNTSTISTDDPKKLSREDRKLLAIMKAIERMERQEQRKQEHQAKQAAHRRESDPGIGPTSTNSLTVSGTVSNSNSNSNDGMTLVTTKTVIAGSNALVSSADDAKDEGMPTRSMMLKRRKRKGRARTVSTNTRRNRLDSVDSVHSSDDTLQSPPISGTTSPVKHAASLLMSLSSNNSNTNSQFSTDCKSPERPSQPTTPSLPTQPSQPVTPTQTIQQHQQQQQMENCNSSSKSNSAHSSPDATPPPPMSSAYLLVAAAMEPLESAAAAAAGGNPNIGFKFPKTKKGLMNEWLLTKNDTIQPASSISPCSLQPYISPNISNSAMAPTSPIPIYNKNVLMQAAQSFCGIGNNGSNGGNGNGGSAKKRWLRQAISEDQCDSPPLVEAAVPPPKKRRIQQVEIVSPQRHEDDISCTMESETTLQELATEMRQEYGNCTISTISPPISMDTSPDISNTSTTNHSNNSSSLILASELIAAALSTTTTNQETTQITPPPPRVLLDPRLAPRLNSEQLVGTVEKTLSFLGFDQGDTSPVALQGCGSKRMAEIVTPAKRKLSITEYRQRKKLNVNDRGSNDEVLNTEENSSSHSPQEGPLRNRSNSSSSATSGVSTDLDELTSPTVSSDPKAGALSAFNSEPTELEKQRELGSLRLKKAFGLSLVDENRKSTALADVEKILKSDLPELIMTSVSLASPNFSIPGNDALPTLSTVHQTRQQSPQILQLTAYDVQQEQSNVNNINNVPSTTILDYATQLSPPSPNTEETFAKRDVNAQNIAQTISRLDSNIEDTSDIDNRENKTLNISASATEDIMPKNEEEFLDVIPLVLPTANSNRLLPLPIVSTVSLTDDLLPEVKQPVEVSGIVAKSGLFYTPDDFEEQETVSVEESAKDTDASEYIEDSVLRDSCTVATSYVPPFNNPLYPSTDYTSYGSIIDDEGPYAGRNPSPPPNMDDS